MNKDSNSAFRKVDLHIHTPESLCYSNKSATIEQIVDTSLSAGLDVIAVTDHSTATAIDSVREAASGKDLIVFPGIELTTQGGHVIALFELDSPVKKLVDFLDYVGVDLERRGDGTLLTGDDIMEVIRKIDKQGGIAVAAHIERWPSGFLETSEPKEMKMAIHASKYLSALEITQPQKKRLWNNGEVRDYPKKYACIQGSDAHALNDIGRRPVYIQMNGVNLEALRLAFLDYEEKILFPDEFAINQ